MQLARDEARFTRKSRFGFILGRKMLEEELAAEPFDLTSKSVCAARSLAQQAPAVRIVMGKMRGAGAYTPGSTHPATASHLLATRPTWGAGGVNRRRAAARRLSPPSPRPCPAS